MAYDGQQSGDIRATLALSRAEAANGTSRTLNLPGWRSVVVPVPAGINDVILTIAFAPSESYGSQPFPNPGTDFPTEMVSLPPQPTSSPDQKIRPKPPSAT